MDLNFPLSDVRVGNTVPADREVPDACTPASAHVCRDASAGDGKASPEPAESVRLAGASRQLGKTPLMTVRGGEVVAAAACAVAKRPLPIPSSREWFALFTLCPLRASLDACSEENPSSC